eukprot:CAMPEP_0116115114 /NCGR_PEP_ID=MMETSP0329-20121206/335_1 /TAXON_ID=697910 /ORGANISM="Pseudo-nitzschia arenysensis, Strain B593" /LENGTH=547 /DNA_ID=CAMNT_0003608527 /DNA_START=108 /DNA_END=1750 /DNA_ORIENTATION=-
MMRQRPPTKITTDNNLNKHNIRNGQATLPRRTVPKQSNSSPSKRCPPSLILFVIVLVITIQVVINGILHDTKHIPKEASHLRGENDNNAIGTTQAMNSYDVLLKNTIHYKNFSDEVASPELQKLQEQIQNLRSQITTLESKAQKYTDDPRFFPFVIRDSRHLTPVQIDPDFHVFDYVDLTQAKQPKSKHSQLLHNARVVEDEILEAKRANQTDSKKKAKKLAYMAEKNESPCQEYSIECYAAKNTAGLFLCLAHKFPSVEYYFYVEADNDLCVPMTMVKDLALTEKRYFINTGIGFSGWIMSREFLELYGNATQEMVKQQDAKTKAAVAGKNETTQEIRPDVLASYYLTDKRAWTVTRQYWVSHTTLESLGIASLTVKDRRQDKTGERMKLDKHLPRCLEPRRGKWKVSRRRPYLDPRDRFGWDYFDYEVCPNQVLFPCKGQDQLKELVEDDWRVANETGALARHKKAEEKRRQRQEKEEAKQKETAKKIKEAERNNNKADSAANKEDEKPEDEAAKSSLTAKDILNHEIPNRDWLKKLKESDVWEE